MSIALPYSDQEIIHQAKISGQIPALLDGIINRKIILEAAHQYNLTVSEAELQHGADQIRHSAQLIRATDTLTWLQKSGLTLDDFEEMVSVTVLSQKLASHLFAEQAEAVFVERQLDYTQAALSEICLDDADLALELYYSIKERELTFHDVARQYCQDTELGRRGGYLGFKSRSEIPVEVRSAVFAANPPQLLQPIRSKKSMHLIFVDEIRLPQLTPSLKQQLISELFLIWLKQRSEFLSGSD